MKQSYSRQELLGKWASLVSLASSGAGTIAIESENKGALISNGSPYMCAVLVPAAEGQRVLDAGQAQLGSRLSFASNAGVSEALESLRTRNSLSMVFGAQGQAVAALMSPEASLAANQASHFVKTGGMLPRGKATALAA
jgi:hypothetical protein